MGQGKRQQKYLSAQEKLQTATSERLRAGLAARDGRGSIEKSQNAQSKLNSAKNKVEKNKAPKTKGRKP